LRHRRIDTDIRESLETLILRAIRAISQFALAGETGFMEKVCEKSLIQAENSVKESRRKLTKSKRRCDKVSGRIKKLYESYATDKIPENTFAELLAGYNGEQAEQSEGSENFLSLNCLFPRLERFELFGCIFPIVFQTLFFLG
jgi:hypothetical protein